MEIGNNKEIQLQKLKQTLNTLLSQQKPENEDEILSITCEISKLEHELQSEELLNIEPMLKDLQEERKAMELQTIELQNKIDKILQKEESSPKYDSEVVTIPAEIRAKLSPIDKHVRKFESDFCNIYSLITEKIPEDEDIFYVIEGEIQQVQRAKKGIEDLIAKNLNTKPPQQQPIIVPKKPTNISTDEIHVFVDWSNIVQGSTQVKLNIPVLIEVVEKGRSAKTRIAIASKVKEAEPVWALYWKRCNYNLKFGAQGLAGGKMKERFVDEALHSAMLFCHYTHKNLKNQTAILLSGDGNDHETGTANFPMMMDLFLEAGWKGEIWSWKKSLSGKLLALRKKYN
jgi:hypothetical protein